MDTIQRMLKLRPLKKVSSGLVGHVCSNKDLLMGIELEIENIGGLEVAQLDTNPAIWNIVEDGSLRPPHRSWEFVSYPLTLDFVLAELTKFFHDHEFGPANYSDRTSVHVHTNVLDFTPKQLSTLTLVYTVLEDVLFEFVNHYKKVSEGGYYRDTNIYCIPWSQCRMNYEMVKKIFSDTGRAFRDWQKYTALNLLPVRTQGTVEWRHMHGTNDMDKLSKWLNIIGAIMKFSKNTDFDEVVKTIQTLNDTSAYKQFFQGVLGELLPYNDTYAGKMAEGVIGAKYAMINKDKKEETKDPYAYLLGARADEIQAHAEMIWNADAVAQEAAQAAERGEIRFNHIEAPVIPPLPRDLFPPAQRRPRIEATRPLRPEPGAAGFAAQEELRRVLRERNDRVAEQLRAMEANRNGE